MRWLTACYTHPVCGCVETRPFTVTIGPGDEWPKLRCGVCDCDLHTSDITAYDRPPERITA